MDIAFEGEMHSHFEEEMHFQEEMHSSLFSYESGEDMCAKKTKYLDNDLNMLGSCGDIDLQKLERINHETLYNSPKSKKFKKAEPANDCGDGELENLSAKGEKISLFPNQESIDMRSEDSLEKFCSSLIKKKKSFPKQHIPIRYSISRGISNAAFHESEVELSSQRSVLTSTIMSRPSNQHSRKASKSPKSAKTGAQIITSKKTHAADKRSPYVPEKRTISTVKRNAPAKKGGYKTFRSFNRSELSPIEQQIILTENRPYDEATQLSLTAVAAEPVAQSATASLREPTESRQEIVSQKIVAAESTDTLTEIPKIEVYEEEYVQETDIAEEFEIPDVEEQVTAPSAEVHELEAQEPKITHVSEDDRIYHESEIEYTPNAYEYSEQVPKFEPVTSRSIEDQVIDVEQPIHESYEYFEEEPRAVKLTEVVEEEDEQAIDLEQPYQSAHGQLEQTPRPVALTEIEDEQVIDLEQPYESAHEQLGQTPRPVALTEVDVEDEQIVDLEQPVQSAHEYSEQTPQFVPVTEDEEAVELEQIIELEQPAQSAHESEHSPQFVKVTEFDEEDEQAIDLDQTIELQQQVQSAHESEQAPQFVKVTEFDEEDEQAIDLDQTIELQQPVQSALESEQAPQFVKVTEFDEEDEQAIDLDQTIELQQPVQSAHESEQAPQFLPVTEHDVEDEQAIELDQAIELEQPVQSAHESEQAPQLVPVTEFDVDDEQAIDLERPVQSAQDYSELTRQFVPVTTSSLEEKSLEQTVEEQMRQGESAIDYSKTYNQASGGEETEDRPILETKGQIPSTSKIYYKEMSGQTFRAPREPTSSTSQKIITD